MKLFTLGSANGWNDFLKDCERGCMVNRLADTQVRIQRGMAKLAKEKLNTEEMITFYCRLSKSLDDTIKKIDKKLNPVLNDDPLKAKKDEKSMKAKKDRDANREAWRKKNSY